MENNIISIIDELIQISDSTNKANTLANSVATDYFDTDYSMKKGRDEQAELGILWDYDYYSTCAEIVFYYIYAANDKINSLIDTMTAGLHGVRFREEE